MKKVIITGITGQDGSYMVDYLLKNTNDFIYGIRRRGANPNLDNIKHNLNNPRFKVLIADLADSSSIDEVVKKVSPDYFINFAAQSFVGSSWEIPLQTFDVTALGVLRCLEAIRKYAPHCRFYSAGSSEEMGDVLYSPQDLKHEIRPRSPYGAAKASARHLTKVYRESYDLYAIHCILYNHESERRGEEFVTRKITKNVARIHDAIKNNTSFEPLELGNIEARRDWSHAQDFVEAIWIMLNQNKPKEYILSSNETHTVKEFVEKSFLYANITGFWRGEKENEKFIGIINNKEVTLMKINPDFYRPAEVELLLGDSSLARKDLNWNPKISFDKLVEKMTLSDIQNFKS
jgi:GDPmannose 4,6-dehydratase